MLLAALGTSARADYACQNDSNVCSYSVDTGSTSPVDLGGGGHTADRREWIVAPNDKYLVNAGAAPQGLRTAISPMKFSKIARSSVFLRLPA